MNLNDVKNFINYVLREKTPDLTPLTKGRFNDLLEVVNLKLFEKLLRENRKHELRKLLVVRGWNESQALVVDNDGHVDYPDDYYEYSEISHTYIKNSEPKTVPINVVDELGWRNHVSSAIEYPVKEYPIAHFTNEHIRVLPKNIRYINLSYYKLPTVPEYKSSFENGYEKYDSINSVDLVWSEPVKPLFISMFFTELGVTINAPEVLELLRNQNIITNES